MERTKDMIAADEEVDRAFFLSTAEIRASQERDKIAELERLDNAEFKRKAYNRAYNKRYYSAHKVEINKRCAAYRAANRAKENERRMAWREKNAEYETQWQKAYYRENRDFILTKKQNNYAVERAYRNIMSKLEGSNGD